MIAKNKEKQYAEKIKDHSINMLKYELQECQTNIDAELLFGRSEADKKLLKRLEVQKEILEKEIQSRKPLPETLTDIRAELKAGLKILDGDQTTNLDLG